MKINSEHLYKYINELATNEKVKFNVYYDDQYVTQIYWNGESFEWDTGTFTSEAFFNPLYDFIPIEEEKKIPEKLEEFGIIQYNLDYIDYKNIETLKEWLNKDFQTIYDTLDLLIKNQNKIIDYLKSKGE